VIYRTNSKELSNELVKKGFMLTGTSGDNIDLPRTYFLYTNDKQVVKKLSERNKSGLTKQVYTEKNKLRGYFDYDKKE